MKFVLLPMAKTYARAFGGLFLSKSMRYAKFFDALRESCHLQNPFTHAQKGRII